VTTADAPRATKTDGPKSDIPNAIPKKEGDAS
jgi:hypothetical protein